METQPQRRKREFDEHAKAAKELADLSLREVDEALREDEEIQASLQVGVRFGNLTTEEAEEALYNWRQSRGIPITDDDTLASPLGYIEPTSILD